MASMPPAAQKLGEFLTRDPPPEERQLEQEWILKIEAMQIKPANAHHRDPTALARWNAAQALMNGG